MQILNAQQDFPPIDQADEHGLLAIGGDLSVERLAKAYNLGIFPWYEVSQPILWWSPNPRMVLFPDQLKVSKSMRQVLKKDIFQVTYNTAFEKVIRECATIKRPDQEGTWITEEMIAAYIKFHQTGMAHSVEVWQEGVLVGGLYGVYLKEKKIFCGESMFAKVSNASKVAFIKLVRDLRAEGVRLIDCQVYTPHLESLGAMEIPRAEFLKYLK